MGIPEASAWRLMPLIGTIDIVLAVLLLLQPRRVILVWMSLWCVWTALLRPLSGTSMWEFWERGGNFGPPILFLILSGKFTMRAKDWFGKLEFAELTEERLHTIEVLLRFFLAFWPFRLDSYYAKGHFSRALSIHRATGHKISSRRSRLF